MNPSQFVYITYIRTTPEILWEALTEPAFTKRYWFGMHQESEWTRGAAWKLVYSDGEVADAGEILEIEPDGDVVRLPVTHSADGPHKLLDGTSKGWPARSLKPQESSRNRGRPAPVAQFPKELIQ